jgi:predicted PurR-regulated permease PerM
LIVLLGVAGAALSIAGLRSAGGIVGPTFLALMIVITIHPLPAWLRRHGVPTWVAVVLTMLTTYAFLLALATALVLSVARLAGVLPTYSTEFSNLVAQVTAWLRQLGVTEDQINSAVSGLDLNRMLGVLQQVLTGAAGILSDLLFILALLFFLILDATSFPQRLAVAAEQRPHVAAALTSFARGTRQYILVSTVFGLIVAVADVVVLYWLAIPLPLLWGLLSFITNYIPNIGFVLGLVPPALLALLQGGVRDALLVVLAYSVINVVIQSLIQPKFVGDAVGLSVTLTILSLVFWSYVIGPLGALLAVPLSLFTKALLIDADPGSQWLVPLISIGKRGRRDGPTENG